MSINITVHGSPVKCSKKKFLLDEERWKKDSIQERRKLRLEQVRQQSKDLASRVRNNVELAKKNQLQKIEDIKEQELKNWREKNICQKHNDYQESIMHVGLAHRAAEEDEKNNSIFSRPCTGRSTVGSSVNRIDDKWGEIRPTEPTPKKRKTLSAAMTYKHFCKEKAKKKTRKCCDKENLSNSMNTIEENNECNPLVHIYPNIQVKQKVDMSTTDDSSYLDTKTRDRKYSSKSPLPCSESQDKNIIRSPCKRMRSKPLNGNKYKNKLVKTPSVVLAIDSECDSSEMDIEDFHESTNMKFSKVSSRTSNAVNGQEKNSDSYFPSDYKASDSSVEITQMAKTRFTQISDLIKQHDDAKKNDDLLLNGDLKRDTSCLNDRQESPLIKKRDDSCSSVREKSSQSKKRDLSSSSVRLKSPVSKKTDASSSSVRQKSPQSQRRDTSCSRVKRKSPISQKRDTSCPNVRQKSPVYQKTTNTAQRKKIGEESKFSKAKSPDRLKRSSNLKSTSKVSTTKSDSISQQNNRVQFFDYCNKFEKRYDHPNVVRGENSREEVNAMQQAELETQTRNTQLAELEKLRQKCEVRSQKALEREQIRRDYEALTAKLEAMTKGKTKSQGISNDAHFFSESRLNKITIGRQSKMNTAVESVLQRPALITCPEVESIPKIVSSDGINKISPTDINLASYKKSAEDDFNTLNSSDSCASILLNYVNGQSKLITEDLDNCDNSEKAKKLKELLDKINCLQKRLMEELEKTKDNKKSPDIEDVVDNISVLRKEREKILLEEETEKKLEQREKKLKKKEAMLEKKLKEFFEMRKENMQCSSSTDDVPFTSESIILSPRKLKASKPVEIIIKVKEDKPKRIVKSPFKSPRKRSSLINIIPRKKVKTPKKKESKVAEKEVQTIPQADEISSSTSYQSPPKDICTALSIALERNVKTKQTAPLEKSRGVTSTPKEIKSKDAPPQRSALTKKKQNPSLGHYIQRLLGMSRQSIEMLGVSSSEVETPSSSIVNTLANKSETESDLSQKERINRLERFIEDNYSFLGEVEESLKTSMSNSTDSSLRAIEEIWKRTLKNKEHQKQRQKEANLKTIKPILKKGKHSPVLNKSVDDIPVHNDKGAKCQDADKIELVSKYTQLTDNCTQRIAELTEMINKVRREKQKILEITLSSGSGSARTTTEYVEFAEKPPNKTENSKICEEKILIDDAEKVRLEKNKLTGVSRDSGISMSRPLTALDFRESPAMQICDKISPPPQEQYEPVLKDIPKPGRISTSPLATLQPVAQKITEYLGDKSKKGKPPASIKRFSPQLVEDVPHELSTILEVDTSATPRTIVPLTETLELEKQIDKISYLKFPTFDEFSRNNQFDLTHFDPEISSKLQLELQELVKISNNAKDLQYKEFSSDGKYTQNIDDDDDDGDVQENVDNLIQSLKLLNLSFKRFPTHQEYLQKLGTSDLMNSKSIEGSDSTEKKDTNASRSITSIESFPDIVEELLRRNIIKHAFRYQSKQDNNSHSSEDFKSSSKSTNSIHCETSPEDGNQYDVKLNGISTNKESCNKSPPKYTRILSGMEVIKSSSNQSNSDNIEKDLDRMGLKWASLMLRKSQRSQEVPSSSTSSSFLHTPRKKSPKKHDNRKKSTEAKNNSACPEESPSSETQKDNTDGQPLNLREFLAKELKKRTHTLSCSSTEDSLASQILRSLLGSESNTSISKKSSNEAPNSDQLNRILTSTPVPSTSPKKNSTSTGSQKLFSGESLSSVRYSHSGSEAKNNVDVNPNSNSDDNLIAPNAKLESDKLTDNNYSNERDS